MSSPAHGNGDDAGAPMAMTAGPTVFTADELAALVLEGRQDEYMGLRCRATARRARSLSPSRRSPKLRHTNGRLEPTTPSVAAYAEPPKTEYLRQDSTQWEELARGLANTNATNSVVGHDDDADDDEPSELELFPAREGVQRCHSCFEPNRRSRQLYIFRRDQGFQQLCAQNTRRIIAAAKVSPGGSNNDEAEDAGTSDAACAEPAKPTTRQQELAMKALKYRKLLKPATGLDEKQLADPSFDVLEYLTFCKT